jgi:hypothetical protein
LRIVSLVPSLTEAVALSAPSWLIGATGYCTHPAGLEVARVGGSKYPDLERILALKPDLVLMNEEENRLSDAEALKAAGVRIHVTFPRTVDEALVQLGALFELLELPSPEWLAEAREAWARYPAPSGLDGAGAGSKLLVRAVIPVWRRPWIVLGPGTFAGDMLARLGVGNVFGGNVSSPQESGSVTGDGRDAGVAAVSLGPGGDGAKSPSRGPGTEQSEGEGSTALSGAVEVDRYPRVTVEEIRAARPKLMVFPDEPYLFTADDGPECFPETPYALVPGRLLTWHGPSLAEAACVLPGKLSL